MLINGKTVIITGGASGFGEAFARRAVSLGAKVIIADIDAENGTRLEAELNGGARVEANDQKAIFVKCDVRNGDMIHKLFDVAEREFGGADIMCNNAGVIEGKPYENKESWKVCLDVNLKAVIEGTYIALERIKAHGTPGVILNTGSIAGIMPSPVIPVYSATKVGVHFFTQALAGVKATHNIRVVAVAPWFSETPLLGPAMEQDSRLRNVLNYLEPVSLDDVTNAFLHAIENESLAGDIIEVSPGNELYVRPKIQTDPIYALVADMSHLIVGIAWRKLRRWWGVICDWTMGDARTSEQNKKSIG